MSDDRLLDEPSIRRALQHIEQGCQCSVLQATDLIRHINALTDTLAASQARADALALVLTETRALITLTPIANGTTCVWIRNRNASRLQAILAADPDALLGPGGRGAAG